LKILRRREFLVNTSLGLGTAFVGGEAGSASNLKPDEAQAAPVSTTPPGVSPEPIDFRYAPTSWQTVFCFPDDRFKTVLGDRGELKYGHPGTLEYGNNYFPQVVAFSLLGMGPDEFKHQTIESPAVPIVRTQFQNSGIYWALTTFATQHEGEGRVDNVILEVRPRGRDRVHAVPVVTITTKRELKISATGAASLVTLDGPNPSLFVAMDTLILQSLDLAHGWRLDLGSGASSDPEVLRCFLRFPLEGQQFDKIEEGLKRPFVLLEEARAWWQAWKPFEGNVGWRLPGRYGEFLVAAARDIQQQSEEKKGTLAFQIGPTVYRDFWPLDAHFILEAARYLGYDADAQRAVESEWTYQKADGQIVAGGGPQFWKGTAIPILTLIRQAELSQDWTYFHKMQPQVQQAVQFLIHLRDEARRQDGIMGKYGLLPPGFADGGQGGICLELTNTIWVLAGLKALVATADRLGMAGFEATKQFYNELRAAFFAAARQQMRKHPAGFDFLPMVMKEDPQWSAPDRWESSKAKRRELVTLFESPHWSWRTPAQQPVPQLAQWALANTIYPGQLFDREDPVVRGFIALMHECTEEDVPANTGWLHHGALWTYDAAYVAHALLWADQRDAARRAFTGFLNHASPLYGWREEQPLHGSLEAAYSGDMPDATADAECILYLRHMLILEDDLTLRLLAGIGEPELSLREPYEVVQSPTRFGRVRLSLEPLDRGLGWRLQFERAGGPAPKSVQIPSQLGLVSKFESVHGAPFRRSLSVIQISPEAQRWEATWKSEAELPHIHS
jgi:hypothetical protein